MLRITDRKECADLVVQSHRGWRRIAYSVESHSLSNELRLCFPVSLLSAGGCAMQLTAKVLSLSAGALLVALGGAAWLCSRAIPKCTHGENNYSFPRTVEGKTTRTCSKCGHQREYDMATMRFLTGHFVSVPREGRVKDLNRT
jgi:hypothetical protein